ncbi:MULTISPECIES: AMP-binding protein [unclassified Acidaminococcus]|uniref:AMP-binding protein n=1 Tax=unclassified Acidaminococcus TaxID=2635771 RepID=UPI00033D10CF|nr:AMP-binding protein [Acidaminococcus sp. CAG:542]CDE94894.1 aMP-dependent synthetase and ligase [Acidaminococcus sp. CAG:542]
MDYGTILEQWARVQPEKACLVEEKQVFSYGEMARKARVYRDSLKQLGIPRQTVLIIRPRPAAQLEAFLGAELAGWVPVLGHPDLSKEAADELARVRQIGWIDDGILRPGCPEAPVPARELCMGVLSSGSTGLPKLMFRTYGSWGDFFPEQDRKFQVDRDTVGFCEGSMSFTGNLNVWAQLLHAGATLVLATNLRSIRWKDLLDRYPVTLLYLVPVKLKLLLQVLERSYPAMKTVLAGSQLLDGETARTLKAHFPSSQVLLYYGASELDYITWLTYEELLAHPQSVGKPCPGVKVELREGMIWIDTPYHVAGLSRPCTLKDMGYFDKDGYLIFLGRRGQVINKGGLTISCSRVEQALLQVPGVRDACVVPVRDEKRGEDLGAGVVLEPGITLPQVRKALRKTLLPGEIPGRWEQLDQLPLTGVGKVDYKKVKESLAFSYPHS